MAPVPIELALSVVLGSSLALASRRSLADEPLWKTPALWALLALEAMLILPVGAYGLWRFPDWSLMYLVEPGLWGVSNVGWSLLAPGAGLGAFLGVRRLILRSRLFVGVLVLVAAAVVTALAVSFGRTQLMVVGTTEAFRADPTKLRSIVDSQLIYILPGATLAVFTGWGMTLWRLILLGYATREPVVQVSPSKPSVNRSGSKNIRRKTNGDEVSGASR